jgi:hypothetical protein
MSVTVGTNLTPVRNAMAWELAKGLNCLMKLVEEMDSTKTLYGKLPAVKVFFKDGAPVSSTEADSPGSDLCFIWDKTNLDLYLVHTWVSSTSFTVLKVLD